MTHVAFLLTDFGDGGVERMFVNNCRGLHALGADVALITSEDARVFLDKLPDGCLTRLPRDQDGSFAQALTSYLLAERPRLIVSGKLKDDAIAVRARALSGWRGELVFRVGNPLAARLRLRTRNPVRRYLGLRRLRALYAQADRCIAVTQGIAEDLATDLGVARHRIHVLPNPVLEREPDESEPAALNTPHPWLVAGQPPVLLAAGGLRRQKDFPTLMRAFAIARQSRGIRLIILGDGRQRVRLQKLARRLKVADDIDMPGWVPDLRPYLSAAGGFVLSSRWEGFGNVLVEAAAKGVPIVATDCPTGPREILDNGRFGELVPVGEPQLMAEAMVQILDKPPNPSTIRLAAQPYTLERSAVRYAEALGIPTGETGTRRAEQRL